MPSDGVLELQDHTNAKFWTDVHKRSIHMIAFASSTLEPNDFAKWLKANL